jgi:hypothetical protein
MVSSKPNPSEARPELLRKIAQDQLHIPTLIPRDRDCYDFYDVAVWNVEAALQRAYRAGYRAGRKEPT